MSIIVLDSEKNYEIKRLISLCKSDSPTSGSGANLREAHYKLGGMLANEIVQNGCGPALTVIIMMRAGLCFGMGIADKLESLDIQTSVLFHYNDEQWKKESENCLHALDNDVLLVDAVINTGDNIIQLSETLPQNQHIIFVTNVLSEKAKEKFENRRLFTVRISQKSFVGSKTNIVQNGKGPDTGDRLFNTR